MKDTKSIEPLVLNVSDGLLPPEELIPSIEERGLIIPFDKPIGISSFGVVALFRKAFGIKKIGHAGTLDPLATGLLVIAIGRKATRHIDKYQAESKVYTGKIVLGATSETDDAEGPVSITGKTPNCSMDELQEAANSFTGTIEQAPPKYSARKMKGKRMYDLARKGIDFKPPNSIVKVNKFDITTAESILAEQIGIDSQAELLGVEFIVECEKGTYIRSLARDLGEKLGSGGYLASLRRTKSGYFEVQKAMKASYLEHIINTKEYRADANLAR